MANCYVCGEEITKDNRTKEHILLNAIGGRLKSRSLICITCNSTFGHDIDDALATQLNFLANQLNISRDDGNPPQPISAVSESGMKISVNPGGKPVVTKPEWNVKKIGEQFHVNVKARTMKDARNALKAIKKELPQIDIDETLKQYVKNTSDYMDEKAIFEIQFGGEAAFRSVCKMATNFYMYKGGDRQRIQHLLPYIQNGTGLSPVWFYYNGQEDVISKEPKQVVHGLVVCGDSNQRMLWSYIELFNAFRFVVVLNDQYDGDDFCHSYVYDVLNVCEIPRRVQMQTDRSFILKCVQANPNDDYYQKVINELVNELGKVIAISQEKQRTEHQENLIIDGIKNSLGKHPEGTIITPEMASEASDEIIKRILPFILHTMPKPEN